MPGIKILKAIVISLFIGFGATASAFPLTNDQGPDVSERVFGSVVYQRGFYSLVVPALRVFL